MTEAEEIIVGECIKEMARRLTSRRKLVKVRGIPENSLYEAIALGAMFKRFRELYPPEAQEVIDRESTRIATLIGK